MRDGYSAKDDALILKCVEDADTVGHGCWIAATRLGRTTGAIEKRLRFLRMSEDARAEYARRHKEYLVAWRKNNKNNKHDNPSGVLVQPKVVVPKDVAMDRDARASLKPKTITAALFGDPLRPFEVSAATKEKAIRRGGNNCNWFLSQGINRCEIGSERVKSKIETLQPWMAGVTFIDLETGMCRFPIGDTAPFIYCGSPIIPGESYCPQCHDICSTARAPKKQRAGKYNCVVQK